MQKPKLLLVLFAFLSLISLRSTAQQAEVNVSQLSNVSVPGTNIKIDLPTVYQWDATQQAYIYAGAASSITFKELRGTAVKDLIKSMDQSLRKDTKLVTMNSSVLKTRSGAEAKQFVVTFPVTEKSGDKKTDFERIVFACGDAQNSVWVSVNYPVVTRSLLSDVLQSCLLTLVF